MDRRGDYEARTALPGPGAPRDITVLDAKDLVEAQRRRDVIRRLEEGGRFDAGTVDAAAREFGVGRRQFNRYRKLFRETKRLTSLLRGQSHGGRDKFRLDPRVDEIVTFVREDFDRHRPDAKDHHAYGEIERLCRKEGLSVSRKTIRSRYQEVPIRRREERKFGKKFARERREHLRGKTPVTHFPLERVQIDHTLVDVVCTGDEDREHIGRAWITVALDECSRAVLAFVLSWEYPNATTVAVLIARMLTPKEEWLARLGSPVRWPMWGKPDGTYVDNAGELSSEAVLLGCDENDMEPPQKRPKGMPHFGGIIERYMGNAMDKMRLLKGATARKRGFGRERTCNPNETAEMSRAELELWLLEQICEIYHNTPHSGIGEQTPLKAWQRGIYGTEKRPGRGAPPVPDKTRIFLDFAEVERRTIQRYGIRWDDVCYWDEILRPFLDAGDKRRFIVKRNPYDISRIWFKHPVDGQYYELWTDDITQPSIPVWEWNESRKRSKAAGDKPDIEAIDAAIERQRKIEQDARNKTARHKRRRNAQRRKDAVALTEEVTPLTARPMAPARPEPPSDDDVARRSIIFKVSDA